MKISKLFHYLYATIMVLPLLFIAPVIGYYTFNKNADTQIVTTYPDMEVDFNQQLNKANYPAAVTRNGITFTNNGDGSITVNGTNTGEASIYNILIPQSIAPSQKYFIKGCAIDGTYEKYGCYISYYLNGSFVYNNGSEFGNGAIFTSSDLDYNQNYFNIRVAPGVTVTNLVFKPQLYNLTQMFGFVNEPTTVDEFTNLFPNDYYQYNLGTSIIVKDYNHPQTNYQSSVESMNNALNETFDLPLFSWSKNSFIKAPFDNITSLFGLSPTNVVTYLLTYWATISIIWLCFDLLMYLPNLIHRWIDRSSY